MHYIDHGIIVIIHEEGRIHFTNAKAKVDELSREGGKPPSKCLLQSINCLSQKTYMCRKIGISKARGCFINMIVSRKPWRKAFTIFS